jgi:hypothetical protein
MAKATLAKTAVSEFAPLADELGALEKEMAPHAQKIARIDALRKALRAGCTTPSTVQWTVAGERFVAVLGACAMQRSIDVPRLVKHIGAKTFAAFATCTLTALEMNVPPNVVAVVVSADNTGTRPLKTFEKGSM